jgi:hypothetical protein
MSSKRYKSKKDLKRKSEELALTERRVFLSLAVVFALTTVVSPFIGVHGRFEAATGAGAGLYALVGHWKRRRS